MKQEIELGLDQLASLQSENSKLQAQLGAAQLDMVAADAQLNDAQDEIVRLQTQLAVSYAAGL